MRYAIAFVLAFIVWGSVGFGADGLKKKITVKYKDARLNEVCIDFVNKTHVNIRIGEGVDTNKKITYSAKNKKASSVIKAIAKMLKVKCTIGKGYVQLGEPRKDDDGEEEEED